MSDDKPLTASGESEVEPPTPDLSEVFATPDGQDQLADIYCPDPAKRNHAAVILIHGGGWRTGERHQFRWHAHRLSTLGYLAVTIDYRLSPEHPFPAALEDCQAAVAWLRREAERFEIDATRIAAVGSSAGGHLAACIGVMDDPIDGVSTQVNCVVDIHGIHDFPDLRNEDGAINDNWEVFLGGPYPERKEVWVNASPALQTDRNSAAMLIIHDPLDEIVPFDQSRLLVDALVRAGRPVQFLPTPGSGHGFFYGHTNPWTRKAWPVVVNWLDQQLVDSTGT